MPTAIVKLSDEANRVLNIVKAKYDFSDKSQALNKLIDEYSEQVLEPQLRPEYVKKLQRIAKKGRFTKVKKPEDLWT